LEKTQYFECFGYSSPPPDWSYNDDIRHVHPDDRGAALQAYQDTLAGKGTLSFECRLIWSDGSMHWMTTSARCEQDTEGKPLRMAGVVWDTTEKKKAEQALREAVQARDDFMAIASHELNTPLTSLLLQLQLIKRKVRPGLAQLPENFEKLLNGSITAVGRITRLVDELMDVTQIQERKLKFHFEKISVQALILEVTSQYSEKLEMVKSPLKVEISPSLVASWDRSRMEQVIVNMLSNAIKHAPGAPIQISVTQTDGQATLIFQDAGPGIPKDRQSKIFERFERVTASRSIGGLGLGLFIVSEIVRGHHGKIHVDSEEGKGTKFIVELPLCPPPLSEEFL